METIERLESEVRGYSRGFPTVFTQAKGEHLTDESGRQYLDFFAGAGVLNYGHNDDKLKKVLLDYIQNDGVTHGLDMATNAKQAFMQRFNDVILAPRGLEYKMQFPGPTGTNCIETALKVARKSTGRSHVIAFTNGFHGMTLGALAATGNVKYRKAAGVSLPGVQRMPFDGYLGPNVDTIEVLERHLDDPSSGIDAPAAFIVEALQAEGGIYVASPGWLQGLERLARKYGSLLILDEIQVGCGRTGPFFAFEVAGIKPDVVCMSKSISGYGLPMALTLIKPEHDVWAPGEHTGTFRGNNLAFVTGREVLDYWTDDTRPKETERKGQMARERLEQIARKHSGMDFEVRGRGLMQGLDMRAPDMAARVSGAAFERGLVIETAGALDNVVKLLPPLTITDANLKRGLDIIEEAVDTVLAV